MDDSTDDELSSDLDTASSVDSTDYDVQEEVITEEFPFTVEDIMWIKSAMCDEVHQNVHNHTSLLCSVPKLCQGGPGCDSIAKGT